MTPDELRQIRVRAGLGVVEFGRALGYTGNDNSLSVQVRRLERGERVIVPAIERLARLVDDVWSAIDRGGGQGTDVRGVLRELDAAGFMIVRKGGSRR